MKHPIFLQPVFKERIWGGTALFNTLSIQYSLKKYRRMLGFLCTSKWTKCCENRGIYWFYTWENLWDKKREIFGELKQSVFPLLTKILDVTSDLSIQVHPGG